MENLEIKRTRAEAHYCDECKRCQESIKENENESENENENECAACQFLFFKFTRTFQIGEGGFGTIYKATVIDEFISLASIKHHDSMEYERRGKVENGYKSAYISQIIGITQNAETLEYGIVMNFTRYGDMRKCLSTNFLSMSCYNKLRIAWDIAFGLSEIHSVGTVHRDLHSGNILHDGIYRVIIGDLELCQLTSNKISNSEATAKNQTTGAKQKIYGVIPSIPLEVLRGENFTTAVPPFHDRSHDNLLINDILNSITTEITSIISNSYAKLIEKCWDASPSNRPTAREVDKKLRELEMVYNNRFKKWIYAMKSNKLIREISGDDPRTNLSTIKIVIHSGAVYTSRLLTTQMVDFSTGLLI
ncbi:hypothetical protein G9A89_001642 [Geosiphon pyriformis]|nr:hypothetical protein G9A89_001642 [Geosiphon pyriformis]